MKCLATIDTLYWRSNEQSVESDRPQKAPVLESRETFIPGISSSTFSITKSRYMSLTHVLIMLSIALNLVLTFEHVEGFGRALLYGLHSIFTCGKKLFEKLNLLWGSYGLCTSQYTHVYQLGESSLHKSLLLHFTQFYFNDNEQER